MPEPGAEPTVAGQHQVRASEPVATDLQPDADGEPTGWRRKLLDKTFEISVVLKGIDGVLEVLGGVLLLVISPDTLNQVAVRLTQHELSEDPHDWFARHLLHTTGNLHHTQLFGALYLLTHGLIKVVLVVALLRRQRWAYPAALVVLGAFIVYQLYRMAYAPTVGLGLLTAFDTFVVWLVWREYGINRAAWDAAR